MITHSVRRRGSRSAYWVLLLGYWLAACTPRIEGPAPVVSGATAERGSTAVTIQRGQTLSEIAATYHVPMRVIAEANGLSPPFRIQVGRTLIIPGAGPPRERPSASVAALPSSGPSETTPALADSAAPAAVQSGKSAIEGAPLPTVPTSVAVAVPPTAQTTPPLVAPTSPPSVPPSPPAPEPPASKNGAIPSIRGSGAFLWPVHGHILANYGSKPDGSHNDGINIGAPRGAVVQAADAGVVAYTGNELRGYGNLILVKHASGWISAYAHCDQVLVKRGEKVARGQVIARVGSTGNVSEPQLHFELRRGQHAVDPREFLAPLPTATTRDLRSS
jgi:murein DD-endopeptidase MepM/ murein hydrolase activator NlpD